MRNFPTWFSPVLLRKGFSSLENGCERGKEYVSVWQIVALSERLPADGTGFGEHLATHGRSFCAKSHFQNRATDPTDRSCPSCTANGACKVYMRSKIGIYTRLCPKLVLRFRCLSCAWSHTVSMTAVIFQHPAAPSSILSGSRSSACCHGVLIQFKIYFRTKTCEKTKQ